MGKPFYEKNSMWEGNYIRILDMEGPVHKVYLWEAILYRIKLCKDDVLYGKPLGKPFYKESLCVKVII